MARALTPQDGYAIMTSLARQATGQKNLTVTDMNTFVSAGETVLASGKENVFNALSIVIGRTLIATRPYQARLQKINALNTGSYTSRLRKISFYSKDPKESGFFNTNLFTNLADGFTAGQNPDGNGDAQSTKSQWEQCQAMPLEMNFAGSTTWQHGITMYEEQINAALRDPVELAQFVAGYLTEHGNDIESVKEAFNRMLLLNKILSCYVYDAGAGWTKGQVVNLTTAYNTYFGTNYTSAQLRSTYLKSFLEFMTATINMTSDYMTERTTDRHLPMTKTVNGVAYSILRHTPKNKQRLFLYQPLFRMAETIVLPELFNEKRLNLETQYEPVDFWQSNYSDSVRPQVAGRCVFHDKTTGTQTSSGDVTLSYVVGLLCDEDSMMTDYQLEKALTSPLDARKGYRTTWLTFAKNAIDDPTENAVIFIMDDSGVTPAPEGGEGGAEGGDAKTATATKKSTSK